MIDTQNPYNVIILYMMDIDFCYKAFLKNLIKKCPSSLKHELSKFYINKTQSFNQYINILNTVQGSIKVTIKRNFRLRLIYHHIFNGLLKAPPCEADELYEILICIEQRIIAFLQEYFTSFPYAQTDIKNFLENIISEHQQNIQILKSFKSA